MTARVLAAPLSLSGRYADQGRAAAAAVEAWGAARGVSIEIHDDASDPEEAARIALALSRRFGVVLGPYGSGLSRAVAAALASTRTVVWNHGGAAMTGARGRCVDVLSPAHRYWAALPRALSAIGVGIDRVAVASGTTAFGRTVAMGAERALLEAGSVPLCRLEFDESSAPAAAEAAMALGADVIVSGGRIEEELSLARAISGRGMIGALVVCGIRRAVEEIGSGLEGWLGPVQWTPVHRPPPIDIGPEPEYPAAQALAACLLLERSELRVAPPRRADEFWDAARQLRTRTFFGEYAVDREGRQLAHAPVLVRWVRSEAGLRRVPVAMASHGSGLRQSGS